MRLPKEEICSYNTVCTHYDGRSNFNKQLKGHLCKIRHIKQSTARPFPTAPDLTLVVMLHSKHGLFHNIKQGGKIYFLTKKCRGENSYLSS